MWGFSQRDATGQRFFSSLDITPNTMSLTPRYRSTVADMARLLACWLAAILLAQGIGAAQAVGRGPLHRHVEGLATALHHHDASQRHHHAVHELSVLADADAQETAFDAGAFALVAALALMGFATARIWQTDAVAFDEGDDGMVGHVERVVLVDSDLLSACGDFNVLVRGGLGLRWAAGCESRSSSSQGLLAWCHGAALALVAQPARLFRVDLEAADQFNPVAFAQRCV